MECWEFEFAFKNGSELSKFFGKEKGKLEREKVSCVGASEQSTMMS